MLTNEIKTQVVNLIITTPNYLGKFTEHDGIITFLKRIWPLREMPSQDGRYNNAEGDAFQHLVNNNDWKDEYLFFDRFNLVSGDEKYFIKFIETIVHPTVRKDKSEIISFVAKINNAITISGLKLVLTSYFEELPIYQLKPSKDVRDLPIDIQPNQIHIYNNLHNIPKSYPCFILIPTEWDDYGAKTKFILKYFSTESSFQSIGQVKIMRLGTLSTSEILPNRFTTLTREYCSLGQDEEYYIKLKSILEEKFISFLLGMRDASHFPKIHEQFENDYYFRNSLTRNNGTDRLARTIRFKIEGLNPNEYYKFNFTHQLPYASKPVVLNFDFVYDSLIEHRIYAIIGENGTGKTNLLSSLANALSKRDTECFTPKKPIYGKVFTVSYSIFDRFDIPDSDVAFNYIYCGLRNSDKTWKSEELLVEQFIKSAEKIKEKKGDLETKWYEILSQFINPQILNLAFKKSGSAYLDNYTFQVDKFESIRTHLSSGQSIILYLISEIISEIRFDSIILFDEPETHLHPNSISSLMNTLFELVEEFQSFCVISTHSPLVIQEISARNVFVIERDEDEAYVRKLERDSFGENLTIITQDIFGNKSIPKHFLELIDFLIYKKKSYNEIIEILETENLPIASSIRLHIKAQLQEKK